MPLENFGNNLESQSNSPSQQKDNSADVAKYENHYRNDPEAQNLRQKQNTDKQEAETRKSQEKQNTKIETGKQEQELSKEVLTPERIDYLLNTYSNLIQSHRRSLREIQRDMNKNTGLLVKGVDKVMGLFTNDNIFGMYQKTFNQAQESTARTIRILNQRLDFRNLTPEQQQKYQRIIRDLQEILFLKLKPTGIVQMTKNEILQLPSNLRNAGYAIKGEVVGVYEGGKAIITGSVDLAKFMGKYSYSFLTGGEYDKQINKQASQIYNYIQKEGLTGMGNKVYEALQKEMERISKLPPEQQAEQIGNIAGNVIAMIGAMGVGIKIANKLGKMGKAITTTEKLQKVGLVSADAVLNGVAESAIGKGLSISFKNIRNILDSTLNNSEKVKQVVAELEEIKKLSPKTPEEKKMQDDFVKVVGEEVEKLNISKPKQIEGPQKVPQLTYEQPTETIYVDRNGKATIGKESMEKLANLPEAIRNVETDLHLYSPKQIEGIKERLGLPKSATMEEIDLQYRLTIKKALERYKEVSEINMARFENEILEELVKKGYNNPKEILETEMTKLRELNEKGELMVVNAIKSEIIDSGFQMSKFSFVDEFGTTKKWEENYLDLRKSTERGMGSYGLDSKYASFLASKDELVSLKNYGDKFVGYTIDELQGKAGFTLYDSMLSGKLDGVGDTKQMLDYTIENLIKIKAIYNIDEKLGFPIHSKLISEGNTLNGMNWFYSKVKPYVEVQIFGGTSNRMNDALTLEEFINKHFNR